MSQKEQNTASTKAFNEWLMSKPDKHCKPSELLSMCYSAFVFSRQQMLNEVLEVVGKLGYPPEHTRLLGKYPIDPDQLIKNLKEKFSASEEA
tara:strand:+ start:443 stop:718 length:276 start_codon:yes stop_codon:yes gene_type:complete